MFHVELAPLGGIFGPLKSDSGVFWPFQATDFIMGILKIWDNFWGFQFPILRLTFLESSCNLRKFSINKEDGYFFRFDCSLGPKCQLKVPCVRQEQCQMTEMTFPIWRQKSGDVKHMTWLLIEFFGAPCTLYLDDKCHYCYINVK